MQLSARDLASYGRSELDTRFRAPLMCYFLKHVGDRAEAEDLTQQVFVRLLARGDGEAQAPLVFRIAVNLLRDRRRLLIRRGQPLPIDDAGDLTDLGLAPEDRTPERVLLSRERLSDVLRTLDRLGERTRDIFILFRLENRSHADIAALLGCSRSTVEKHVMKATCALLLRRRDDG